MPTLIKAPQRIEAASNKPKVIGEFVGRVASGTEVVSIARMRSPSGWAEPAQRPEFDEYTLVLRGELVVEHDDGELCVGPGQAVIAAAGERVRYHTPGPEGAEYIAVCAPAFAPHAVHREEG